MNIVRKILDYIGKAFLYTKTHWKRILGLLLLVGLSALFALKTYEAGFRLGKAVGHCEVVCSAMGGEFSGFEHESYCQCEMGGGYYLNIPLDHEYF
tara:strand:+ start:192 stop:479 length:288 start_codon:yes stop_codon:yes gene_type:complete